MQPASDVAPVEPSKKDEIKKHCEKMLELNKNTNINANLAFLPTQLLINKETGFSLKYKKTYLESNPLTSGVLETSKLDIPTGGTICGAMHTHPNDSKTVPMFSAEDIIVLYNLMHNYNYNTYNQSPSSMLETFVFTVTTKNGTYALKVDSQQFNGTMYANFLLNKRSQKKFEKNLKNIQLGRNNADNAALFEKDFLNFISDNNLGLSLFKINSATSNWENLSLNPNDKNQVDTTSCN